LDAIGKMISAIKVAKARSGEVLPALSSGMIGSHLQQSFEKSIPQTMIARKGFRH